MKINDVTGYQVENGIAVITIESPPVNALSAAVRGGILAGVETALADASAEAIVLICAGRTFFAGADITEFGKPPVAPILRQVQDAVENASKPVVAAIHGTALGGGLELALVAHCRVAARSAKCGLPEVNIGLLPGAGGTQRLPRIVGVDTALDMITSGRHVPAVEAHAMGLVDALADDATLRAEAIAFARRVVAEDRPLRRVRDLDAKIEEARANPGAIEAFRRANARRFRGFLAPEYNIRCIEAALALPFDAALKEERRLFDELMAGPQSKAQRHVFFAERRVAKLADVPAETPLRPVERASVIGAGTMGGGIAMAFLNAGFPVTLVETTQAALDRGLATIRRNYDATAAKGRLTGKQVEARLARLHGTLALEDVADSDLVIEAVFEQMDIKQALFSRIDAIAKPGAILASNTSYLDIDTIAAATSRPRDVIGMHFFSPAHIMRLLEIVRGRATAEDAIATAMAVAKRLGKVGVVVGNCFGFVGNRMLAQRQREAEKLILEGALPWQVDKVLYDFGFPMGPFQMRDMAGMDVGWDPARSSSSTVREILNETGRRGQKTGAGYYDYDEQRRPTPSPLVEQVILDFAARKGIARREIGDGEILERCLYAMVNEAVNILDEGIAVRASDIDVVWVTGYGWPAYRGGPMFWAEHDVGLDTILARIRELHPDHGDDFRPAPLLERLVAEGRGFSASGRDAPRGDAAGGDVRGSDRPVES
ncbi:3-hydroxyacyl-CoA dehydrogenase NAD-binding domain-containing protein [Luteimonas saliphila]|uniref:3-hydroxyacyl-CoA dehydrogenase NAD-binding domain-containing protein n=1 Tax=Luteimonas saliphila TaxID=2804919 RepID=UPI00192E10C0|nr:3-hydroxyacyl-CoA dehydrogenase NAD-binding domain-containing protein [Luteimonas saliphila]